MTDIETTSTEPHCGLSLLRKPFADSQISKLPKPTKKQTDEVKADFKKGKRCTICGAWHHPDVVHLDYVGHAALTNRLLDCDPQWVWKPLAVGADGYPVIDKDGGMWIELTVCSVTRLGYGDAQGKTGGDAMKERIGDALRNAAMRFGAALDLWHKGEQPLNDDDASQTDKTTEKPASLTSSQKPPPSNLTIDTDQFNKLNALLDNTQSDKEAFCKRFKITSVAAMPATTYPAALLALENKLKQMPQGAATEGVDPTQYDPTLDSANQASPDNY